MIVRFDYAPAAGRDALASAFPRQWSSVLRLLVMIASAAVGIGGRANAGAASRVRFVVIDPATRKPLAGAQVSLEVRDAGHAPLTVRSSDHDGCATPVVDLTTWSVVSSPLVTARIVTLCAGSSVTLQALGQPPIKDIYVTVRASRLPINRSPTPPAAVRTQQDISRFGGSGATSGGTAQLLAGQSGVATDSAGQAHVRGEHAEDSYVIDGVPLPDSLSGRQGAIVVPSTIQDLDLLTGNFAPEFGWQTAAVLDITTVPGARHEKTDATLTGGSFQTLNGDLTTAGPIGTRANYVFDFGGDHTLNATEPQQPDDQTAHNAGGDVYMFAKLRYNPSKRDILTLTLSHNPDSFQISNRTGLPSSYADVGQGFGFLGLRNSNGVRPDATSATTGLLGAQAMALPSQQQDGMDIDQSEVNEFATLSWRRQLGPGAVALLAFTDLHAGEEVWNNNPSVNVLNLPVDNSIEYNPSAVRNAHHFETTGSVSAHTGPHELKTGLVLDDQFGNESYQIVPASRLALDELAALDPALAPAGAVQTNAQGKPVLDIDGNPVYTPKVNTAPVLNVHRSGFYRAAYAQDTWRLTRRLTLNYGVRFDWYKQSENLDQAPVDTSMLSPRLNFSYMLDRRSSLYWSYDRLFDTPPLAQGAIVGEAIQPERIDQYEVDYLRRVGIGQSVRAAYYYKDIHNQVDTGLLVPGSEIGLYSAVNFQLGGIHGIELSYDVTPPKGVGLDGYVNYTYSLAAPAGYDNTGAPAPPYNDHDQRQTLGTGLAYIWKSQASVALTFDYGSGLASSIVRPSQGRIPRTDLDLHLTTGPRVFKGHGGLGLDILNVYNDLSVINFDSGFSGTRFQQARRIYFSVFGNF